MSADTPETILPFDGEIVEIGTPSAFQTLYVLFYQNQTNKKWYGTTPAKTIKELKENSAWVFMVDERPHYRIYEIQLPTNP